MKVWGRLFLFLAVALGGLALPPALPRVWAEGGPPLRQDDVSTIDRPRDAVPRLPALAPGRDGGAGTVPARVFSPPASAAPAAAAVPATPMRRGDRLLVDGREFVVLNALGAGGFKTSYLVADPRCPTRCKMVVGVYTADGRTIERLPNTPDTLRGFFASGGSPWVRAEDARVPARVDGVNTVVSVSEYLPHRLEDLMVPTTGETGSRILDDPRVQRLLAEQLFAAVRAFHDRGLVHMDVKIENIMIAGSSEPVTIETLLSGEHYFVLTDHDLTPARGSTDSSFSGTIRMLAPELFREGEMARDTSSTIWSAAATVWEAMTGTSLVTLTGTNAVRSIRDRMLTTDLDSATRMQARVRAVLDARIADANGENARILISLRDTLLNALEWDPSLRRLTPAPIRGSTGSVGAIEGRLLAVLENHAGRNETHRGTRRGTLPAEHGPFRLPVSMGSRTGELDPTVDLPRSEASTVDGLLVEAGREASNRMVDSSAHTLPSEGIAIPATRPGSCPPSVAAVLDAL